MFFFQLKVTWVSHAEQMEVMAWWIHLRTICKNADFLKFVVMYLLLMQSMPNPQLHLAELLDDKSIDLWKIHLPKPHKVQSTLRTRWYHLNDKRWGNWRGEGLRTGPAWWLLTQVSLCLRVRGPRPNKLCHLSHTSSRPTSPTFCLCRDLLWNRPYEQSSPLSFEHASQRSTHPPCNAANSHPDWI